MDKSNTDNSNQEDSQQENCEDSEPSRYSKSFRRRKASRSVSTECHSLNFAAIQTNMPKKTFLVFCFSLTLSFKTDIGLVIIYKLTVRVRMVPHE